MLIYIKGEDAYKAKQSIDAIKARYLEKNGDLGLTQIEPESQINWQDLLAVPLFASSRLTVVKNAASLSDTQQLQLSSFAKQLPGQTVLVVWPGSGTLEASLASVLLGATKVIDASVPTNTEKKQRIKKLLKQSELELSADELEALSMYDDQTIDTILAQRLLGYEVLLESTPEKQQFAYFNAVRARDWMLVAKLFLTDLRDGVPTEIVIGSIASAMRKYISNSERLKYVECLLDYDFALKTSLLEPEQVAALLGQQLGNIGQKRVEWEEIWEETI